MLIEVPRLLRGLVVRGTRELAAGSGLAARLEGASIAIERLLADDGATTEVTSPLDRGRFRCCKPPSASARAHGLSRWCRIGQWPVLQNGTGSDRGPAEPPCPEALAQGPEGWRRVRDVASRRRVDRCARGPWRKDDAMTTRELDRSQIEAAVAAFGGPIAVELLAVLAGPDVGETFLSASQAATSLCGSLAIKYEHAAASGHLVDGTEVLERLGDLGGTPVRGIAIADGGVTFTLFLDEAASGVIGLVSVRHGA